MMADKIYIEPLTLKTVERIIEKEKPDSILSTLGGQTGLTIRNSSGTFSGVILPDSRCAPAGAISTAKNV